MKYAIITEYRTEKLEKSVNQMIDNGWKPLGGVTIDNLGLNKNANDENWHFHNTVYRQAMIKEK
jgi:hypothetical protein